MTNLIKRIILTSAIALAGCATINLDNEIKVHSGNYTMSRTAESRLRTAAELMAGDVTIKRADGIEYIDAPSNSSELSQRIYQKLLILADIHPIDWEISDEEAEKIFLMAYNAAKKRSGRK